MKVPERDWLLLRARLRAFASAVALPVVVATSSGCSRDVAEDDEKIRDVESDRPFEAAKDIRAENE